MTLADLSKKREDVKRINRLRGLPENATINAAIDSRYNSTTITGAYHAGQNASQAIAVAVEKQTAQNDIVGINIQKNLCSLGASLRRRGVNVTCPGRVNCAAIQPAGEQFAAQNFALDRSSPKDMHRRICTQCRRREGKNVCNDIERRVTS